ncbi:centromere protein S-like [Trichoplusia ni]|uniref:Centromere protein S n=1 Tax=Trichoplusia ni TaxID=7111 RepID=A0A7E5VEI6_TRINI|nr:centromere protein S-like [Trichoplusia ni]
MTSFESLTSTQKIRATLHRDVQAICTETCHFLGLEITKPAMEIVAELLYKKLSVYGTDLEAFAKHAKRSTINSDDVKLLVRRSPSLKNHLNTLVPNTNTPKEKRRKTEAGKVSISPASEPKEPLNLGAKKTVIQTPRQKDPETSTSKDKIPKARDEETKEKETSSKLIEKKRTLDDESKNMVIDEMIDLTID